jgi:hypothetical protein
MSTQSNKTPEQNRASCSDASKPGAGSLAHTRAQLDELLERDEISREAFAEYSATADAALASTTHNSGGTHTTAPTQGVEADDQTSAVRIRTRPAETSPSRSPSDGQPVTKLS